MREEAKRTDAIVGGHHDDAFLRELGAVIHGDRAGPFGEGAAVDPEHHRESCARIFRRGPHVQVQAVLTDRTLRHEFFGPRQPRSRLRLRAACAELVGAPVAKAQRRRLRRTPPQVPERWSGEGDTEERGDAARLRRGENDTGVSSDGVERSLRSRAEQRDEGRAESGCEGNRSVAHRELFSTARQPFREFARVALRLVMAGEPFRERRAIAQVHYGEPPAVTVGLHGGGEARRRHFWLHGFRRVFVRHAGPPPFELIARKNARLGPGTRTWLPKVASCLRLQAEVSAPRTGRRSEGARDPAERTGPAVP